MNLWVSVQVAINALRINLMRSILTMLGIIIGVAAVITMLAIGAGAQQQIEQQINKMGSNVLNVRNNHRRHGGVSISTVTTARISEDDAIAIKKQIPSVQAVAPYQTGNAQIIYANANWATRITGVTEDYLLANNSQIHLGREFSPREIKSASKVVLLGQTVVKELFGNSDPVDEMVRIKKVPFKIIGTLRPKGENSWGQDQDDIILTPLSTAKKRIIGINPSNPKSVSRIIVKLYDGESILDAEHQITELLRTRHRIKPGQMDTFRVRNYSEIMQARSETTKVFNALLAAIASVSLLVGGIGIMNIMLVSVTERTREIGLRMAVGSRPKDILKQFLVEAITLCMTGGLIGIGIAVALALSIANFADLPVLFEPSVILGSFLFSGIIGVFFGYYPAKKAAALNPIDALHYE